ncbi:MAG: hypothetical protein EAZ37_16705, partial [Burkholderiales bacterium]
ILMKKYFLYLLAFFATNVFAQSTVQEVMDAGGKRLTTEQLQGLMPSKQFTGKMGQGYETDFKLDKDGSFKGFVYPDGRTVSTWGSWRIENDSYCMDMRYTGGGTNKFCNSIFEVNGKYFVAGSAAKPDAGVRERFFKPL